MGDTRYTRADLANVLGNVNLTAERLDMGTVYTVSTLGGDFLYLVRQSEDGSMTIRESALGGTVHRATVALLSILEAWHLVECARDECQRREAIAEHLPTDTVLPVGTRCGIHGDPTHSGRCATCDDKGTLCATPACGRRAVWYSISEGNRLGDDAPRRCPVCCDAIGAAMAVAFA